MNGLNLTQSLLVQILAREPASVGDLWRVSQGELEPMPFLGDTMFLHILTQMERAHPAVYERSVLDPERPFSDRLAITQTGREVLQGVTDWLSPCNLHCGGSAACGSIRQRRTGAGTRRDTTLRWRE